MEDLVDSKTIVTLPAVGSQNEGLILVEQTPKENADFEYPVEYVDRMKLIKGELVRIRDQNEDYINLGPSYHLTNSLREPLDVDTFSVDYKDKYEVLHRKYYIIVLNPQGRIVGDRYTDIRQLEFKDERYARAEGMTATGKRGGHIASVIENVNMDILQRESHRIGRRVDWHISNSNLEMFRETEEEYRLNPSESLKLELDNMRLEQQRWQAIYGVDGKLGFDRTGTKSFLPTDPIDRFTPPSCKIEMPPDNLEEYKLARSQALSQVLDAMQQIIRD